MQYHLLFSMECLVEKISWWIFHKDYMENILCRLDLVICHVNFHGDYTWILCMKITHGEAVLYILWRNSLHLDKVILCTVAGECHWVQANLTL